jgi:hypothetical protein
LKENHFFHVVIMRAYAGIFIIISLLLLVGSVGALGIPDTLTITSDKIYLTANGVDQATITVLIFNTTAGFAGPVKGAAVVFSVLDPTLGTFSPVNATSDISGKATSSFKVNTKSGVAILKADVYYSDATGSYSNFTQLSQKIDHDKAHFAAFSHPIEGNVSEIVTFNISFTDVFGNAIDQKINLGQQHLIGLHVHGPTPDDSAFFINGTGYGHDIISLPLDKNGNVSVSVQLSQGAGPNSVTMDSFEEIVTTVPRIITGMSTQPFYIEQDFNPDLPPQIPADGVSKFAITYILRDKFQNPVGQTWVWINTSVPGEEVLNKTDNLGQIVLTYGPKSTVGIVNITATSVNNKTVTIGKEVEFANTEATTMVVTANPEFMPSRDINSAMTSSIIASVTDVMGNPVPDENVTFSLGGVGYPGGPYNVTSPPSLPTTTAITDAEGLATVTFIPGSFSAVNRTSSTGEGTVTATWQNTNHTIKLTWKNYPYLSVKTAVNPQTIAVNDTVDVTISLKGDGFAMVTVPIDAVLCTDRSGSMLLNGTDHINNDRMVLAMNAGKIFNAKMSSQDRVGLVSFGDNSAESGWASLKQGSTHEYGYAYWVGRDYDSHGDPSWTGDNTYITANYKGNPKNYGTSQYASIDQNLSFIRTTVNTSIGNMVPAGGTPMREGLYRAVKLQIDSPRAGAEKAVILLTDGEWNTGGNPQGGAGADSFGVVGTGSVITWAKNNNVTIYTIRLGTEASETELKAYANETGGKYYNAPTADDLAAIYTAIAQDLIKDAGVNTGMVTDFQNVMVTNATVSGADVYDYVYNATASTKIKWQDGVTNVTDQTTDWGDHRLNFTIGTMKIGDSWEATFRLKVKKSGSIDIFGTNSALFFNNGTESLPLPRTFLNVVPDLNATGLTPVSIDVVSSCPAQVSQSVILPITWTTTYVGPATTISEEAQYISEAGAHVPFYQGTYDVTGDDTRSRSAQFDMRAVTPGTYAIQIVTMAGTHSATSQSCGNYTYSTTGITFIKLQ